MSENEMLPSELRREHPQRVVHGLGPLESCPSCAGTDFLVQERAGGVVVFVCLACHDRWRYDLGYVWRVST